LSWSSICKAEAAVLETLDAVEWAKLTHAGGSAHDVPAMIRQLLSDKASVRERALDDRGLWGTLCHQDSVWEATAPAVPFLLELVQEPSVRDRGKILDLLSDFAMGGYEDVEAAEAQLSQAAATLAPETYERRTRMIDWTRQTHAAVRAGRDIYLSLLADRVLRVRRSALGVLNAACHSDGELVARVLRDRIARGRDRVLRAALIRALSHFIPVSQETRAFLAETHARDADALARLGAAIALGEVDGEQASVGLVSTLAQALVRPDGNVRQAYNDLFGDYEGDLVEALRHMGERGMTTALNELERELTVQCHTPIELLLPGEEDVSERWRRGPDGSAIWITLTGRYIYPSTPTLTLLNSLLRLTFGAPEFQALSAVSLSIAQRRALVLLHGCDTAWYYDLNLQEQLFDYGVPHTRDGIRDYLEGVVP
jgi:hypothetical protein